MLVWAELTPSHGQVMELVVATLHHDAHEPETLDPEDFLGIGAWSR